MNKIKLSFMAIALIVIAASCKKSDTPSPNSINTNDTTNALYVLSQGVFPSNATTLTFYDFGIGKATADTFYNINKSNLGGTGSDFIIYGSKMYIVMNGSGYVSVANAATAKLIDTISFINAGVNRGPENVIAYGSNVFVSSTDGTVAVIDTTTLVASKFITVGSNPAQMVIYGTNLYVSNTGGYSTVFDSTVSVVNLNTLVETQKIVVGLDPGYIAADDSGNIYVACAGNAYGSPVIAPRFVKVNTATNTITKATSTGVAIVRFYNNQLFVTNYGTTVEVLNPVDLSVVSTSFVTDGTAIVQPYGLDINTATGDVFITDAKDYQTPGAVFCFDKTGKKKFSFSVPTANPIKTVLVSK